MDGFSAFSIVLTATFFHSELKICYGWLDSNEACSIMYCIIWQVPKCELISEHSSFLVALCFITKTRCGVSRTVSF